MRSESPTIRLAVVCLGGIAGVAVGGIIALSSVGRLQEAALAALAGIAGSAAGALATLLTTFTPAPLPGGRRLTDQVVLGESSELGRSEVVHRHVRPGEVGDPQHQ